MLMLRQTHVIGLRWQCSRLANSLFLIQCFVMFVLGLVHRVLHLRNRVPSSGVAWSFFSSQWHNSESQSPCFCPAVPLLKGYAMQSFPYLRSIASFENRRTVRLFSLVIVFVAFRYLPISTTLHVSRPNADILINSNRNTLKNMQSTLLMHKKQLRAIFSVQVGMKYFYNYMFIIVYYMFTSVCKMHENS